MNELKLIECPRDAMQGIKNFIPTQNKISYINNLLSCGFDTIDFGSFVSPIAIPQMRDTEHVLKGLNDSSTKLLAIIANERGAIDASNFERINYLGYPFSISEEFQRRNTNSSIDESFILVEKIKEICLKKNKELVLYISMGFGNPYGEQWHPDIVSNWSYKLFNKLDVTIQSISDTIGCADPLMVNSLISSLLNNIDGVEFGVHLHSLPENAKKLVESAYNSGCRRFDSAIKGFGGCPMAKDELVGNLPTELMLEFFEDNNIETKINKTIFNSVIPETIDLLN